MQEEENSWHDVVSPAGAENLLNTVCEFHDSYLISVDYQANLQRDQQGRPIGFPDEGSLRMIFFTDALVEGNATIELEFNKVIAYSFLPDVISPFMEADVYVQEAGTILWMDELLASDKEAESYNRSNLPVNAVLAEKMRWRVYPCASEGNGMGERE